MPRPTRYWRVRAGLAQQWPGVSDEKWRGSFGWQHAVGLNGQSGGSFEVKSGQGKNGQVKNGQVKNGQVKNGQAKNGKVKSGQVKSKQVKSKQVKSEQGKRRRARRLAERKAHIYGVALELFTEKGFDRVTVDEIVARADVAKGTFFNYFPTKDALLVEYRRSLFDFLHEFGEKLQADSARECFRKYFRKVARTIKAEGATYDVLFREVVARPHLLALDDETQQAAQRHFVRYLEFGIETGEVAPGTDLELLAQILRDLWTGTSTAWLLRNREGSLESEILRRADFVLDLVGEYGSARKK